MKKRALVPAIVLAAALVPAPASAWSFAGHRYIMGRAIELLPPELKKFFDHYRDEIVVRAIDPDLWRNVGWDEEPHHFMNFGARELGDYPFTALPRELGAAIEKFGMATLRRDGMLPWRAQELFGNLRRTFEGFKRGSQYGPSDLILFSAALGHYIQDAHQPFHASNNYDGQLTGNNGIHARFERDLIEKFQSRLSVRPAAPRAVTNARDFAFDGRCIPAGCVAPRSNTPGILGRRALPAGRLARLGATPDFHHGLLKDRRTRLRYYLQQAFDEIWGPRQRGVPRRARPARWGAS